MTVDDLQTASMNYIHAVMSNDIFAGRGFTFYSAPLQSLADLADKIKTRTTESD